MLFGPRNGCGCTVGSKEAATFDLVFLDDQIQLIGNLAEYGVPFSRVIDVMKLFRNTADGNVPNLLGWTGTGKPVSRIVVRVSNGQS